jgi:hypothetical protein
MSAYSDYLTNVSTDIQQCYGDAIAAENIAFTEIKEGSPFLVLLIGSILSVFVGIWFSSFSAGMILFIITGVVAYIFSRPIISTLIKPYNYTLNAEIQNYAINKFIDYYYDDWKFEVDGIEESDFCSQYGYRYGDNYYSSDYIIGYRSGIRFETCQVESTYEEIEEYEETEQYEDSDGVTQYITTTHTREYTVTIFEGEVITLYPKINFRSPITSTSSSWGKSKKHIMDHQKFNEYYRVNGDDPIYIRYVLTQSMMDYLVELKEYLGIAPKIIFIDDSIRITILSHKKFPNMKWDNVENTLKDYFYEVGIVAGIIDILKIDEHHIYLNESCDTDKMIKQV